ncbi:zinc finger protein RFP-like isoform X3 [Malaclemys terrapin pileata]|uniref:zinc finger protein RFP-like isoform X3 n=1 Tax=Malaclemys terrapin pileata TaxID=2991368 RepID=UPI0023A89448|nr:zinc finger protein RFP-like isoform X3 [Malaclemys terrapin pileata]
MGQDGPGDQRLLGASRLQQRGLGVQAAMAAPDPVECLQKEVSCSICLDYFTDPVSIDCGHNFCRDCIRQCSKKSEAKLSCPQCRGTALKRKFRPSRELANVAEIAKRLSCQAAQGAGRERVCETHQEGLKLFCEEDQSPICLICRESRAHRFHTVAPIEEAIQDYKEQTKTQRCKIVSEFEQLRHLLEEQERLLLAQLGELEKEIVNWQNGSVAKLSEEISHLSELISELEKKYQQPVSEFLQDIRSTLIRCKVGDFQQPLEIFPDVEKRLSNFSQKNIVLKETLRKFKDSLPSELEVEWGVSQPGRGCWGVSEMVPASPRAELCPSGSDSLSPAVNVTLDPDTANPHLVLTEDRKSVRWEDTPQDLPNNPERFDTYCCVLGREGFTSGRNDWEVHLGQQGFWTVGIARESVWRKGWISLDPTQGIWAVGLCGGQYRAYPDTLLPLSRRPGKIRVSLDYERGQVAFFDVDNEAPIFTFHPASFNGERILPFFWVWESQLTLCP